MNQLVARCSGILAVASFALVSVLSMPTVVQADDSEFWAAFDKESARLQASSSLFTADPSWTGPLFEQSTAFPTAVPPTETLPWLSMDFAVDPRGYMQEVLRYVVEGNEEIDWRVQDNAVRKWYHAPWMHYDPRGREPLRGLTGERSSRPLELGPNQTTTARNWAVAIYNAPAAYVLGQVWKSARQPATSSVAFPPGSVSAKLLFTDARPAEVPFLDGPAALVWKAAVDGRDVGVTDMGDALKQVAKPKDLRLLQLDIGVRDDRAPTGTGWLFGTFYFDASTAGTTWYEKLVPVGIMWGNDPGLTWAEYANGARPKEGWLNPQVLAKFKGGRQCAEMGLRGRVNGPVDNPLSSCISCHGRALDVLPVGRTIADLLADPSIVTAPPGFAVPLSALGLTAPCTIDASAAAQGESTVALWFRNLGPTEPFTPGLNPLDYSLQLAEGVSNFYAWALAFKASWTPRTEIAAANGTAPSPMSKGHIRYRFSRSPSLPNFGRGAEAQPPVTSAAAPAGGLRITGKVARPTQFTLEEIRKFPAYSLNLPNEQGGHSRWVGASVAEVLRRAGVPVGNEVSPKQADTYLRMSGAEGFGAVMALPEFYRTFALLAYERDREALPKGEGPLRVIVPGDPRPVRWVRNVIELRVD